MPLSRFRQKSNNSGEFYHSDVFGSHLLCARPDKGKPQKQRTIYVKPLEPLRIAKVRSTEHVGRTISDPLGGSCQTFATSRYLLRLELVSFLCSRRCQILPRDCEVWHLAPGYLY